MQQQDALMYKKMPVDKVKMAILLRNKQKLKEKKNLYKNKQVNKIQC